MNSWTPGKQIIPAQVEIYNSFISGDVNRAFEATSDAIVFKDSFFVPGRISLDFFSPLPNVVKVLDTNPSIVIMNTGHGIITTHFLVRRKSHRHPAIGISAHFKLYISSDTSITEKIVTGFCIAPRFAIPEASFSFPTIVYSNSSKGIHWWSSGEWITFFREVSQVVEFGCEGAVGVLVQVVEA